MAAKQTEKLVKIRLLASRSLGYKKLKDLQLGVIKSLLGGRMSLPFFPLGVKR